MENSDNYEYWCTSPYCSIFANHLPSFSGIDITDIRENTANNEHIMLYPNPTNGLVRINGMKVAKLQVCTLLGQLVKTVEDTNEISVAGLPEGVYVLRIRDEKGNSFTERVSVGR